jgi:hypothetical protein
MILLLKNLPFTSGGTNEPIQELKAIPATELAMAEMVIKTVTVETAALVLSGCRRSGMNAIRNQTGL